MGQFQRFQRPHFFSGQLLTAEDLEQEQDYFLARSRRHNRFLHGWGVVAGLGVSVEGGTTVVVEPGIAIDCAGNEVILAEPERLCLSGKTGRHYIAICYAEILVDERLSGQGKREFSRVQESARLDLVPTNPNTNHRGMGPGTPGCGQVHPLSLAMVRPQGSRWRVVTSARSA
jgi:hypothetical protein